LVGGKSVRGKAPFDLEVMKIGIDQNLIVAP
jgi:hypothetical protein